MTGRTRNRPARRCCEARELNEEASSRYLSSLSLRPSWKTACRLARTRFREKKWQGCLSAYQDAVKYQWDPETDPGDESADRTLILAAESLKQLGRLVEARALYERAITLFPSCSTELAQLKKMTEEGR